MRVNEEDSMIEIKVNLPKSYLDDTVYNPIVLHGVYYRDLISHMNKKLKTISNSRILTFDTKITYSSESGIDILIEHNGEHYHSPSRAYIIDAFEEFINENRVVSCVYCGEQISKKTASSFYKPDNLMCKSCEKIAKDVIIRKRMEEEYDNHHALRIHKPSTTESAGPL